MAKKEYIERGALKPLFDERYHTAFIQEKTRENPEYWRGVCAGVNWGLNTIFDAPAADVVEVVRCKDCKHWRHETECRIEHYECNVFCGAYGRGYTTNADDFCSYGERKTDGGKDDV